MACWATTQIKPRRERVAKYFLEQFDFQIYVPRIRRYQIRYHRRVEFLTPLFPGYCFTRIELQSHGVRWRPGVIRS